VAVVWLDVLVAEGPLGVLAGGAETFFLKDNWQALTNKKTTIKSRLK